MTRPFSLLLLLLTASAADGQADGVPGACEAALHDQRVVYESQLASLRQQLHLAGRENREARAQLVSLRARCSRTMDHGAQVVKGAFEPVGSRRSGRSRPWAPTAGVVHFRSGG